MGFHSAGRNQSWSLTRVVARRASTVVVLDTSQPLETHVSEKEIALLYSHLSVYSPENDPA